MALIPPDLDFLVNKELIQTCFGLHQLILNFTEDTSISIEHKLIYANKSGRSFTWLPGERNDVPLQLLLDHKITAVQTSPDQSFNFPFDNGDTLIVEAAKNTGFESYQITHGTKYYVV